MWFVCGLYGEGLGAPDQHVTEPAQQRRQQLVWTRPLQRVIRGQLTDASSNGTLRTRQHWSQVSDRRQRGLRYRQIAASGTGDRRPSNRVRDRHFGTPRPQRSEAVDARATARLVNAAVPLPASAGHSGSGSGPCRFRRRTGGRLERGRRITAWPRYQDGRTLRLWRRRAA